MCACLVAEKFLLHHYITHQLAYYVHIQLNNTENYLYSTKYLKCTIWYSLDYYYDFWFRSNWYVFHSYHR